ncbi:hypothetical protein ZYGR_0AD04770 [Zygosaccharomyces rouxii]|uniref:Pheromone-regulated membrane protein 10 n=2 Tax=Zygosaccharomyces rouxii TaxID=4956 RepID=PRM10_ZYGRC|nr:uncharacterized protein ZYRO0G17116g [Zygosaccharomyces rouxii]C5E109.1 RecName: Full=Pheromone-regulated membrane protein 10 [Zygosaccharomyces rouxii CBS 732]KAH9202786.1 pheromone-regulated membrane protein 10 [Zygosaccharomyces rouxii]GAV51294.1 hypothetical protein ZYGR_0AD04770 [Zygosaccharomyces rouxii]CAR29793.1 ZYRO0G17116p [Zygosaccharomyces rouxii]
MGKSDHLKLFGKKSGGKDARSPETRSRNSRSSTDNRSSIGNNGSDNPLARLSDLDLEEGVDDDADFDWDTLPLPPSDAQSLDNPFNSGEALPSFRRRGGPTSNDAIERDAVDTIRDTSGAYEEPDSASDGEDVGMNDEYQRKRERLVDVNDSASEVSSPRRESREGKNVRFHTETDDINPEDPIAAPAANTEAGTGTNENGEASSSGMKSSINVDDEEGSETSSSNNENKLDHFKKFFRRGSVQNKPDGGEDGAEKGMKSMKDDDNDDEKEGGGGFFSKVIQNIKDANNGLAPGLRNVNLHPEADPEKNSVQEAEVDGDDIQLVDFNSVAKGLVKNYSSLPQSAHHQKEPAILEGDTMYSPSTPSSSPGPESFVAAPMDDYDFDQVDSDGEDSDLDPFVGAQTYVPPPQRVRGGVLGSLLKMYQNEDVSDSFSTASSIGEEPAKPSKPLLDPHFSKGKIPTAGSLLHVPSSAASHLKKNAQQLAGGAHNLATKHYPGRKNEEASGSNSELPSFKNTRPKKNKKHLPKFKKKMAAEAKITVHIADLLQRHRFILRMCKGLMMYGAPTHRLEEYMIMTSRVLEIDGQFLYLPGCMIVSFGDATTRTSEVQLVRCAQGLNLWKLHQVHSIYKQVVHDTMSASEGNILMDKVLQDRNLVPSWVCVLLYGFCSAMVTPYAFGGDWVNLAVSFFIGTCVGALQFIVSARSNMYSNVFEISASIVVSFVGRAFGSIGGSKICFGAVTQGSLALILPGYIILCGALELQSRNLVAGSVRMFYAIIYSLFLSFGITLGAALFGWMYKNATNETNCPYPISPWYRFLFVPAFTIGISLINQAHWIQLPVMVTISCTGYVVTYYSGKHFKNSTEFTASLAAFVIGIMGNLYSRVWKGLAVSAMLPAIFVQVPSGVASQSSLLSGLQSANELIKTNSTKGGDAMPGASDLSGSLSFGITMIQVSIGITVGLFGSSLIVYPFGKKSTGLFSL